MAGPFTWKSVLCLLLLVQPVVVLGQSPRQRPPSRSRASATQRTPDPRELRAARERAVAVVGATGRDFVETYGEDAVAAIGACSQSVALQLVEFHIAGGLCKLPRPHDLVRAIGKPKHGDEVASWAMAHAGELAAADYFDAYLLEPLSYALALKKLEDGAAAVRERRRAVLAYQARRAEWHETVSHRGRLFCLGVGVTAVGLLVVWRYRQRHTE